MPIVYWGVVIKMFHRTPISWICHRLKLRKSMNILNRYIPGSIIYILLHLYGHRVLEIPFTLSKSRLIYLRSLKLNSVLVLRYSAINLNILWNFLLNRLFNNRFWRYLLFTLIFNLIFWCRYILFLLLKDMSWFLYFFNILITLYF